MADLAVSSSSSELTRTKSSVTRIAEAWIRRDADKGRNFVSYLKDFLRLYITNDNTRRSYSFAILEFFDWYELTYRTIPMPDQVERSHALRYAEWLRTRDTGIEEFRLHRDASQKLEAAVYDVVKQRPGIHISDIRKSLAVNMDLVEMVSGETVLNVERDSPDGLNKFLACLVIAKVLSREPTVEELRAKYPEISVNDKIDANVFAYSIDRHTDAKGFGRSGTIVARLNALSSFWKYVIDHTGENTGNKERALTVNIWKDPLGQYVEKASSFRKASRASKTPDVELLQKLIDTTGTEHESAANQKFEDVRDRAILLFLFYTAVRASELGNLKRADVSGSPPVATVLGKGSRVRQFTIPGPAMDALRDLEEKIRQLAADAEKRAPGKVPRVSRLLRSDAPLFPAIMRWGCQAKSERAREEAGLTRQGIAMMQRRRCITAGILPGTPEFKRVHSHGWRHLAAKTSAAAGVPINIIQAALGHRDLSTTGIYTEEQDPRAISLFPTGPRPAAASQAPPVARRPPVQPITESTATEAREAAPSIAPKVTKKTTPKIIDVVGYEVPEVIYAPTIASASVPEVPPEERLVAIGEQAPPPIPLPSHVEIEAMESASVRQETFDNSYSRLRWGEKLNRSRIHQRRKESAVTDIEHKEDVLITTYVGDDSGLIWWTGPTERIKPEMPIMSPRQAAESAAIRTGLEDLWLRWVVDQETDSDGNHVERGPTAARALLEWFRTGLDVSEQAAIELRRRGGRWIDYASPKSVTDTKSKSGGEAKIFREHRDDKLVLWYSLRGYSFMTAVGREGEAGARLGRVVDDTTVPSDPWANTNSYRPKATDKIGLTSWYDVADPVAELPADEKVELFDWLMVLTGRPPIDKTKRYKKYPEDDKPSLSRVELSSLILQMCAYDSAEDERKDTARARRDGHATEEQYEEKAETSQVIASTVDATVKKFKGQKFSFNIADRVADRVKARGEADEGKGKRSSRASFYIGIIRELFGDDAAKDPALGLYALCGRGQPMAEASLPFGGEYKDLFRIDISKGTIVHEPDFALRFAQKTGAHSECVARRIARHMWELRKMGHRSTGERLDELVDKVASWAFYRVPCPAPLESELRERLSGAPPVNLIGAFASFAEEMKLKRPKGMAEARRMSAQLESQAELARERASVIEPAQLAEGFQIEQKGPREAQKNYIANARRDIPGPITIIIWLHMYSSSW